MGQRRHRKSTRFDQRRARWSNWWTVWRVPALLAIVGAVWWFIYRPYAQEGEWVRIEQRFVQCSDRWNGAAGCVFDGDTIIIGQREQRRRVRLTGFDAPEIKGACPAESQKAVTARAALHNWLANGDVEWSGGDEPARDQYGRELREARRVLGNGRHEYLADMMIERELASPSGWGSTAIDWCR